MSAAAAKAARPRHDGRAVHRIVFVTGKGGVGKSAVAAATAVQLARAGQRVLLAELGSRSHYGPLLGLKMGAQAVPWQPRVDIAHWTTEESLREYLAHYLVIKAAADKILNSAVVKALVAVAPGVAEMAVLGKLTAPMRHAWYERDVDVVVVDATASGQFMALLRAPRGLAASAGAGPMRTQTEGMARLLAEPAICEYRLVTLAEEMPVAEACELARQIRAETGIAPRLYCNRLIDVPEPLPAVARGDAAAPFVEWLTQVAQRQRDSLAALDALGSDRLGAVCPLPLVPTADARRQIDGLADALDRASVRSAAGAAALPGTPAPPKARGAAA